MDAKREVRSFLMARDPSIDRRFRPRPDRKVRLFDGINEEAEDHSSIEEETTPLDDDLSQSTSSASSEVADGALVYLRLRPVDVKSAFYNISGTGNTLVLAPQNDASNSTSNKNNMEKHFSFNAIFDSSVGQKNVYDRCIGEKIELEDSFNILTYGTSGSGKTFTLMGDDMSPGIIPRSLENIFTLYAANIYPHPSLKLEKACVKIVDDMETLKESQLRQNLFNACNSEFDEQHDILQSRILADHNFETRPLNDISVLIWISFVEIYNELVYDLLAPIKPNSSSMAPIARKNLKILGNDGNVFIKGLTTVFVKTSLEALKLLRLGLQRVTYAATSINENSSRSHCIFVVDVLKYHRSGTTTKISYKFCDLAGSERLSKTGNVGSRLKEAQRINTSLLVLGRCLDAANNSRKRINEVIPYRESKLTMLLQAALLGKEKLTMIVNVTPTNAYYEENLNVLNFASIAKNIIFKAPVVKQNNSRFSLFLDCTKAERQRDEEIEQLLQENFSLREEMKNMQTLHANDLLKLEQSIRNELVDSFEATHKEERQKFETRLQKQLNILKNSYELKIEKLTRHFNDKIEDLREELDTYKENAEKKRRSLD